jgi:diguanylate cyclase (GGDEF)-like protein
LTSSARELLESAGDRLPSPNGVALAIMEMWEDDSTTVQQLARLVQADPALSGRLLKLANSAAMGSRPVSSIPEAIVRVGMQTVGQLAVAFSLIDSEHKGLCEGFDYDQYWSHCLLMAVLSRGLAQETKLAPPEDMFACGLLARIGMLALSAIYPQEYGQLLTSGPESLVDAEHDQFGVDHNELSEALMLDFRVPTALAEPARYHEQPNQSNFDLASRPFKVCTLLHLAYRLANMALETGPDRSRQAVVSQSFAAKIGLTDERLGNIFDRSLEEWQEWSKLFELPSQTARSYGESAADDSAADQCSARPLRAYLIDLGEHARALQQRLARLNVMAKPYDDQKQALQDSLELKADLYFFPGKDQKLSRLIRSTEWGDSAFLIAVLGDEDQGQAIDCLQAGADSLISIDTSDDELSARLLPARRFLGLERAWRKDREELTRTARELALAHRQQEVLSLTDQLTDLPNRRAAMQALHQAWSQSTREQTPLAVLMLDLDHFKLVNDQHGHAAGDKVLKSIAKILKTSARDNEFVSRIGGEEFVLIASNATLKDLIIAGERLRRSLENASMELGDARVSLTASIGVAQREECFDEAGEILNAADKALYAAKSAGRNQICFYQAGKVRKLPGR